MDNKGFTLGYEGGVTTHEKEEGHQNPASEWWEGSEDDR